MRTAGHYRSEVLTARADTPLCEIADVMLDFAVGCVVVVDADEHPLGIVTDRDLLCRAVARGLDPESTTAGDVMTKPLLTGHPEEPLERIVERMRSGGVRRIPIVRDARLHGIVTLDDLVFSFGRDLDDLGGAARGEVLESRARTARSRRRRVIRHELEEQWQELREQIEATGGQAREVLARELQALRKRLETFWKNRSG